MPDDEEETLAAVLELPPLDDKLVAMLDSTNDEEAYAAYVLLLSIVTMKLGLRRTDWGNYFAVALASAVQGVIGPPGAQDG